MDKGITANDTTIVQATSRIDEFNIRVRQLLVQNNQMDIESINVRRSRDNGGTAPLALLSYNDIVSMKPGSRGRHDMSKEWGKFETRLMIKLREQEPLQNFFGAMATALSARGTDMGLPTKIRVRVRQVILGHRGHVHSLHEGCPRRH